MSENEPKSKRSWTDWAWWVIAVAMVLLMIIVSYKSFGGLGNAFLFTIAILAIIVLAEELIFRGQGLVSKIAEKLKKTKR